MQPQPTLFPIPQPEHSAQRQLLLAIAEALAEGDIEALSLTLAGGLRLTLGKPAATEPAAPPAGGPPLPPALFGSPRPLSELEQRIAAAVRDSNGPLYGKNVAARVGIDFGPKLKYELMILEERGILLHDEKGYAWNPETPAEWIAGPPTPARPTQPGKAPGEDAPLRERILAFLRCHPGQPQRPQAIVKALDLGMLSKVERDLLEGMVAEGVIRIEPGQGYVLSGSDADEQED